MPDTRVKARRLTDCAWGWEWLPAELLQEVLALLEAEEEDNPNPRGWVCPHQGLMAPPRWATEVV